MIQHAASKFLLVTLTLALVVCLSATLGVTQVHVLSSQEAAALQKRLPEADAAAKLPALSTYLKSAQLSLNAADNPKSRHVALIDLTNVVRVADDVAKTRLAGQAAPADNSYFVYYTAPAMSQLMRLPNAYPSDGALSAPVTIIAAQDEYEPASFQLYGLADVDKVQLSVSDLKSDSGATFPKENLDLKVVKVWYQNRNGWFSYFSDVGLALVPELLLNDENLIRVDTVNQANFARVRATKPGEADREVWITAPKELNVPFDHYQSGFVDAATLQPVKLEAGRFKQFVLTAHVTEKNQPGIYRGNIAVQSAGRPTAQIPVVVRVLPFVLPAPRAYLEPDKKFIVSLMGSFPRIDIEHPAFMPTLKNLRKHNILHNGPGYNTRNPVFSGPFVKSFKEAGFDTDLILLRHSLPWEGTHDATPYTFDQLMTIRRASQSWAKFFGEQFGHTNAYLCLGDEPSVVWVMKTRRVWRIVHEAGLKVQLAGHHHLFTKAGHVLDLHESAGTPDQVEHGLQRRNINFGHISFYANQHNGSENPDFVRRQHGLLGYLSGMSGVYNYEFAYGPWNDLAKELYKPMVLAYPSGNGLVDTLAWEGFREGIDDVRYATKLMELANQATKSDDLTRIYQGRKALLWLTLMDGKSVDLAAVRLEMIRMILSLTEQ